MKSILSCVVLRRGRMVRGGRYGEYGEFFPLGRAGTGSSGNFFLRPVSASIIRVLAHSIIRNGSMCIGLPDTFVFHFHIQLFRTDFIEIALEIAEILADCKMQKNLAF